MLARQLIEHFAFQQAAIEQAGVETGQAAGIAMAIGGAAAACVATPGLLVLVMIDGGLVNARVVMAVGSRSGHLQQALGGGIADIALATGDVGHAMELFVSQADVEIQAQRLGNPRDDDSPGPRPSARRSNSPTSQP